MKKNNSPDNISKKDHLFNKQKNLYFKWYTCYLEKNMLILGYTYKKNRWIISAFFEF